MTPKAVLFDCDGVLVDSEPITDAVLIANLARHGLRVSETEVAELFLGGTIRNVGEEARRRGATIRDDWATDMYAEIYARLRRGCPLMPGVEVLLKKLDEAGIATGVGSNGSREKMEITLGQNGLWGRFAPFMVSAHDGVLAKPAPDIYLRLAETLGIDAADAVVIEDSPTGVKAGLAAGARVIGFAQRTPPEHLSVLGVPVAASMDDVAAILGLHDG